MASATGIPDPVPNGSGRSEEEPLLGGPGDASQPADGPLYYNFFQGEWGSYGFKKNQIKRTIG